MVQITLRNKINGFDYCTSDNLQISLYKGKTPQGLDDGQAVPCCYVCSPPTDLIVNAGEGSAVTGNKTLSSSGLLTVVSADQCAVSHPDPGGSHGLSCLTATRTVWGSDMHPAGVAVSTGGGGLGA